MFDLTSPHHARPRTPRSLVAIGLTLLMALASLVALAPAAQAATPGITANILLGSETYDGVPVVNEGQTLTLRVQYNTDVTPGSTVEFELGDNVTLTGVPSGNSAIASVTQTGNKVAITFKDPWPSDVNQGVFDLKFSVDAVDESAHTPITWKIDGDESSADVIVRNSGDQFANVSTNYAKSASPGNLDSFVSVSDGQVVLNPTVADQDITYTLRLDSPEARENFAINDQLPAGMDYVAGSFNGQLTSWDEDGLNRSTAAFAFSPTVSGNAFTSAIDVPGPSVLQVTYRARITDVAAVRDLLQAQYDALGGGSGTFTTQLTNTASFGGTNRTASVRLRGTVAGVNVGAAFAKTAEWNTRNVRTDADGTLTPPTDMTYTLKADLRQWTGGQNFTLARNVVISDVLPTQARWLTEDAAFLTASGITLTEASSCPDAAAFADDAFVGQYCVDGQRLLVNVGKDNTTNASIAVKSQLTTVAGLPEGGQTSVTDATPYRWRNTATFDYRDGAAYSVDRDATVVALPDESQGLNDSSVFLKTGSAFDPTIDPGQSVTMNYAFTVAAGKGIDARTSHIVDYIDTSIFDLSAAGAVAVSGTYDGQALTSSDFTTSTDADGNLVIELSASGKAVVDTRGADKRFVVLVSLVSKPFDGKVTKTITNRATLFGQDDTPLYWSKTSSEATSYGDEAEVRKRVYDSANSDWVASLPAAMDGEGSLVEDTYVYRVQFIPHGSYDNVTVVPVADLLPAGVDFLGFVQESDAATAADPTAGPVDIGGNLQATYDAGSRTVTLAQKAGTKLQAGPSIAAYFAVRVTDASAPIVNKIGDTSATIVPLPSVSVGDRVWVDSNRDGRQGEDERGIAGVVLTIVGPDGEPVTDVNGDPVGPVTTDENGMYSFDHLPVLAAGESYTVRIDRDASAEVLKPYVPTQAGVGNREGDSSTWHAASEPGALAEDGDRDPTLDFGFVTKTYAIGDKVWIDADRNGVQDAGEDSLPGVKVDLLDAEGAVVATTTTDEEGRYLFDNLAAGTYRVQFTLTDEQKQQYRFTGTDEGSDDAVDSDADPSDGTTGPIELNDDNAALADEYPDGTVEATQGIDPTWDAGVVRKTYAIGDKVWIDADRNGVQGDDEESLAGVKVDLLDADGAVVATTTTDEAGRYLFDNLVGGTYRVRFTLTDEQKKQYRFTLAEEGSDDAVDSDADPSDGTTGPIELNDDNAALTTDYEHGTVEATQGIDPTWDAGVVRKTYAIGDKVWIDANDNGRQDASEKPLAGVKVDLLDADGAVVATTTTDAAGRYLFDNLAAGTYRVQFTLTDAQKKRYKFTRPEVGTGSADSDAAPADGLTGLIELNDENAALTTEYPDGTVEATQGIDPTWDAGVVLKPSDSAVDPGDDTTDPVDNDDDSGVDDGSQGDGDTADDLASTGGPVGPAVILAALVALASGGTLLATGRRRRSRPTGVDAP